MEIKKTLDDLRAFVQAEHEANLAKLFEVWEKPLSEKIKTGETQRISSIQIENKNHLVLTLGEGDSRFREGDMICLHCGDAKTSTFIHQASIEAENDNEWLVRAYNQDLGVIKSISVDCFADPDSMDLKPFFDKALNDIAESTTGVNLVLPLLAGKLDSSYIYNDNFDDAADFAEEQGLNEKQIEAVGKGVAAKYLSCIQGPPGTGKTKVISLIARLLVNDGQRVLITSHTHMAINNALNKVATEGVPVVKVGSISCTKTLNNNIKRFESGDDWQNRPDTGYVIGATPFATCTSRLENFQFDTVIFDEASQITIPLAVMAMRKAKRFVFVGDHKQLPPVVLSKSIFDGEAYSVFAKLLKANKTSSVMLHQTYRMNSHLSCWPSKQYYSANLNSVGVNAERLFSLPKPPIKYSEVFASKNSFVFLKSPGVNTRTSSVTEAKLVVELITTAVDAGMELQDIAVVTPYRNHGKVIRKALSHSLGSSLAKKVVTDTVERMQGQEREMIIISLCSTDMQFIKTIASFFFQSERLNVAITRPMTKLILIGPELPNDFSVDARNKSLCKMVEGYNSLLGAAHTCIVRKH